LPVREEASSWLHEAESDLRHARKSLEIGDYNWSCFASQQAAEKCLKALALHLIGEHPRGHDLLTLYRKVKNHRAELDLDESTLSRLSVYYVISRYPNAGLEKPSKEITKDQAQEALDTAVDVFEKVSKALRDP